MSIPIKLNPLGVLRGPYKKTLKYISNQGWTGSSPYINLNMIIQNYHRIEIVAESLNPSNYCTFFGINGGTGNYNTGTYVLKHNFPSKNYSLKAKYLSSEKIFGSNIGKRTIEFGYKNGNFIVSFDGDEEIEQNPNTTSFGAFPSWAIVREWSPFIFGMNNYRNLSCIGSFKLYSFKIYEYDVLIRDLIPVLDNNNEPCLYDKILGDFYYNNGNGQFIYE